MRVRHSPVKSQRGQEFLLCLHPVRGGLQEADGDFVPLLGLGKVLGVEVRPALRPLDHHGRFDGVEADAEDIVIMLKIRKS